MASRGDELLGVVLDAGAFIGLEHRRDRMVTLARHFRRAKTPLVTSAGVVAQVWRGGTAAQVPIAFLLAHTTVVDLSARIARTLGLMLATSENPDPVDAHIVLLARERAWRVLTSDPDDLRALDPAIDVEIV